MTAYLRRTEEENQKLRDLVMTMVDGVGDRLDRLESRDARREQAQTQASHELAEIRDLLATGRDQVEKLGERMDIALKLDRATRLATSFSLASWVATLAKWQKGGVALGVVIALAWTADKGPGMVRFLNHFGAGVAEFWKGMAR